jgi:hypothetical protein
MRVARVTFIVNDITMYIDKPITGDDDGKADCDALIKILKDEYKAEAILAVMVLKGGITTLGENGETKYDPFYGAKPGFVHLGQVPIILLEGIGVYEVTEEKESCDCSGGCCSSDVVDA